MEGMIADLSAWIEGLGAWAYVGAPLFMAFVAVFPIPAEAPAVLNGMLFGTAFGSLITWAGALTGAQISFELSRRLGRPAAERLIRPALLERADATVMKAGWWGLLAARFVPLIAFTALNWGAGLTPIPRWRFVWTTAVGIIPGAILFTASGTGLSALVRRFPSLAGWLAVVVVALGIAWLYYRRRTHPGSPSAA